MSNPPNRLPHFLRIKLSHLLSGSYRLELSLHGSPNDRV